MLKLHKNIILTLANVFTGNLTVGESRQPWVGICLGPIVFFFKKYERKNLEIFTGSSEKDFGNLCPSLVGKIGFSFFKKNKTHFQETKVNFVCLKFFSIKIGKTEF